MGEPPEITVEEENSDKMEVGMEEDSPKLGEEKEKESEKHEEKTVEATPKKSEIDEEEKQSPPAEKDEDSSDKEAPTEKTGETEIPEAMETEDKSTPPEKESPSEKSSGTKSPEAMETEDKSTSPEKESPSEKLSRTKSPEAMETEDKSTPPEKTSNQEDASPQESPPSKISLSPKKADAKTDSSVPDRDDDDNSDEEDELVEEDPIPPYLNPAGIYGPQFHQKHRKQQEAAVYPNIPPPLTIGGPRDQITVVRRCNCRGSKCLRLYCDCFAYGIFCGVYCSCKDCNNHDKDRKTRKLRNEAICNAFIRSPQGAFRLSRSKFARIHDQMPEAYIPKPIFSDLDAADDDGEEEDFMKPKRPLISNTDLVELPPSSYTMPMQIDDSQVAGIAFTRVHPMEKKNTPRPASPPRRLYHNLMLSPSKIVADQPTTVSGQRKRKAIQETELQRFWKHENEKALNFFNTMQTELDKRTFKSGGDNKERSVSPQDDTSKKAREVLKSVEEDVRNIQRVVNAAEVDVMTRLYKYRGFGLRGTSKKPPRKTGEFRPDPETAALQCDEELPNLEDHKFSDPARKELTIMAAQDAALLRETARIVRIKARELCEKRMKKEG